VNDEGNNSQRKLVATRAVAAADHRIGEHGHDPRAQTTAQECADRDVGGDWAEDHRDVEIVDGTGGTFTRRRFPEGLTRITRLHALISERLPEPAGWESRRRKSWRDRNGAGTAGRGAGRRRMWGFSRSTR